MRIPPFLKLLPLCLPTILVASEPPTAPNVILIVADDQGSVDLGCYGATDLHTPHYPYQGDAKWLEHFQHLDQNEN